MLIILNDRWRTIKLCVLLLTILNFYVKFGLKTMFIRINWALTRVAKVLSYQTLVRIICNVQFLDAKFTNGSLSNRSTQIVRSQNNVVTLKSINREKNAVARRYYVATTPFPATPCTVHCSPTQISHALSGSARFIYFRFTGVVRWLHTPIHEYMQSDTLHYIDAFLPAIDRHEHDMGHIAAAHTCDMTVRLFTAKHSNVCSFKWIDRLWSVRSLSLLCWE